jgi:hypothetical protein
LKFPIGQSLSLPYSLASLFIHALSDKSPKADPDDATLTLRMAAQPLEHDRAVAVDTLARFDPVLAGIAGDHYEALRRTTFPLHSSPSAGADALIKAVVADFGTADGRSIARDGLKEKFTDSKPEEIKAKCIETLRQRVLDTKAPADATAFKTWLRQISQHVAEAAKEGGFLGIGGVAVSEAEKATLAEISNALKLPA